MNNECHACLNEGVFGGNAVPICEMKGWDGEHDESFCPHCGAFCISFAKTIMGHAHKPSIVKGTYQIGSSTLKLNYNG